MGAGLIDLTAQDDKVQSDDTVSYHCYHRSPRWWVSPTLAACKVIQVDSSDDVEMIDLTHRKDATVSYHCYHCSPCCKLLTCCPIAVCKIIQSDGSDIHGEMRAETAGAVVRRRLHRDSQMYAREPVHVHAVVADAGRRVSGTRMRFVSRVTC